ncbi:GNAT family N-acetyltransferase [Clostridium sp. MSJ-11]|uniref:GNAT family N-acetyltransferase n=1 Tax=Clostridium mobile TaxID=2841512 RepID=A0ABS6EJY7_9CLOT|nr:GNAT family N-acetyltransferase [Clostridium mobile]MBU5484991.1 GNAT family N-acetyltransferase [Clostridium mobile]
MLNHLGTKVLETERLILRPFRKEDARDAYDNWTSDSDVTKYLTWTIHEDIEVTKKVLEIWIDEYIAYENYNWGIELKERGSIIGSICLMNINNYKENCEIGYCISKDYWNRGITTEAFSRVIKFAFEEVGFERITGRHHINNLASGKVMEKCGLKYEGTLRKITKNNTGLLVDCKYYSILKEEF